MEIKNIYTQLIKKIPEERVKKEQLMKNYTTFKIGGKADILVIVKTIEELKIVLKLAKENKIPLTIFGNGSNVLVRDNGIRGIVIINRIEEIQIVRKQEEIEVSASSGVKLTILAQKLLKEQISGFEFASGIPGTIGGAIRMNAGAHGKEMKDIVKVTTYLNEELEVKQRTMEQQEFSYRKSIFAKKTQEIILGVTFSLQKGKQEEIKQKMQEYATYRKEKQPIQMPSAGSTFKRGDNFITAKLIDECGLKGFKVGDAEVSKLHAGFIVNNGEATAEQVITLITEVKKQVKEKFHQTLALEIEIMGE